MVLKLSKKVHFLQFCAGLSQKPKCVKAIYTYGSESFYYSLSENDTSYRSLSPFMICHILPYWQLKYIKMALKILISDQIVFAAVVYFGQVFGFCRLINKSVLKFSTNNV